MPFSWWDLGEGMGYAGQELELWRITCPFCTERGNFEIEHRASKRKANSSKALHFDTLRCGNCAGYVMVLWSAQEFGSSLSSLYSFRVLPSPLELTSAPEHWPAEIGRYWLQSHRAMQGENWDSAALTARSALQLALRGENATGNSLRAEIDNLASRSLIPPLMQEWAHELRLLANESAHPDPGGDPPEPDDVRDVIRYLDFLFEYLYDLPRQISTYRSRREGADPDSA